MNARTGSNTIPRASRLRVQRRKAASDEPLYRQIHRQLREQIESGALPPGTRLPSSRALSASLRVARNTIELALAVLQREGLVVRRVGSGTVVADPRDAVTR